MRKMIFIVCFCLLAFSCDSGKDFVFEDEKFHELSSDPLYPMGTYFWDEFATLKDKYNLSQVESGLLGEWTNITFESGPVYNRYTFYPNKFFILKFRFENFKVVDSANKYFNKALGTWELVNDMVRITIYAILIEDAAKNNDRNNKEIMFVEHPYSVDVINIKHIDPLGYTRRPINDTILSKELRSKVSIKEKNKTNNLMIRNIYSVDVITASGKPEKNYGYFSIVPELAQQNLSGMDIVTNPELIEKYLFDLWP